MAEASVVLLLEARDRATAQLKHFGESVEQAGQKAQVASVRTGQMSSGITGMVERVKQAQMPLRNLSAVLGGFGLSFIGISAVTMGLRRMVTSAIESQQAILGMQLNMRRWGLTLDDVTRLTDTFGKVLGRTWAVQLAGLTEDMALWLESFGPANQAQIINMAKRISELTGVPLSDVLKGWKERMDELGPGIEQQTLALGEFRDTTKQTEENASSLMKTWIDFKNLVGPILEGLTEGAMTFFLILAKPPSLDEWIKFGADLDRRIGEFLLPVTERTDAFVAGIEERINTFGVWIGEIFWPWISESFAKGWEGIISFGAKAWGGFLGFWVSLWDKVTGWFVDKWTAISEWWGELTTGIGDFWKGVWEGMKGVGISVYNFIIDRLNDALAWANSVIRLINSALGRIGLGIPEIGLRLAHATMPAPVYGPPMPALTYTAPAMAGLGGGTIIIPVQIGDKVLTEIIVDTLTGAVRAKELSE